MAAANKPVFSRAPSGVVVGKPVALRLMEQERDELHDIAKKESRSMAAQARIFFLQGLEQYKSGQQA
ncbi:hypothetical protein [Marinobacter oulmenensis]|uniref:Ribbon-helix-helix protein, CopG family n=1 Tax=Marinobacter oulmenensis TaxID=643747 RepID=A0A840U8A2_9GAMM|nr:hypothetical protein [Marinobacter oulmenensis]MBB5320453.1 hypothetical protein [Marinobacter oulmenensis]